MSPRAVRRSAALLLLAVTAAGCSKSVNFPAGLAGNYQLVSANGQALPYTLPGTSAGTTAVLISGVMILMENGRFHEQLKYTLTTPGNPPAGSTAETLGDVSASGSTITFHPTFENSYSGTISGDSISVTHQATPTVSVTYLYVRE